MRSELKIRIKYYADGIYKRTAKIMQTAFTKFVESRIGQIKLESLRIKKGLQQSV